MKIGKLAPWYRWIEYAAFGASLERARFEFLSRLAPAARVLIAGEGDGRTLARVLKIAPAALIDVLEVSPEMIALARQRAGATNRVAFHCQDALAAHWPPAAYDAIVTNFFLDCFTEEQAREIVQHFEKALKPGGVWLLAEFAIPENGWQRLHARLWISTMYRFFRIATGLRAEVLPPIETLLREAGLNRVAQHKRRSEMMISEVWIKPEFSAAPRTSP